MSGVKREAEDAPEDAPKAKGKAKQSQAVVSSCVLVTVDYSDTVTREKVKALGASWCKPLSGWVLPESSRAAAMAVVLGQEPSADDMKAVEAGAKSEDPAPSKNAGAKVCVAPHKKAVLVTGETMKVKDVLKAMSGSWNKGLSGKCRRVCRIRGAEVELMVLCTGWCFPGSKKEQILRVLRADPTNTVEEGVAGASQAAQKKKSADEEFINDDDSD
jgi:hypothetical protein